MTVLGIVAPAYADEQDDDPGKLAIHEQSEPTPGNGTVTAPPKKTESSGDVSTDSTIPVWTSTTPRTLADSARKSITPPGGKKATLATGYSSKVYFTQSVKAKVNGTSYGRWLGTSPVNASSVGLTDNIWATSIGITSVSVGASGGSAGASVINSTIVYSNTVSSTWRNEHNYSGYTFSGLLMNVSQTSSVAARFGSSTFILANE